MNLAAWRALVRRDVLVERSYRLALPLDFAYGVAELALYYFIARVVGAPSEDLSPAPTYFDFAVAGVLMALVISTAAGEISRRIREDALTGTLELVTAQPLRSSELALGSSVFPVGFAFGRVALYIGLAALVLDLSTGEADWPGVVLVIASAALAFLAVGVLAAAATVVFKRGQAVVWAATFAMSFLGGAFFPISALPDWLEPLGRVMPTRFAFDGLRDALYAGSGWAGDVLVLLAIGAVALPASLWVFASGFARVRRDASLPQY